MNSFTHLSTARTYRRLSAAATQAQGARLLALEEISFAPTSTRAPLWDEDLLDRLTQPLSRVRE